MRYQSGKTGNRTESVTVLSLSPLEDDHASLEAIVGHSKWVMFKADRLDDARSLLRRHDLSVIICEKDLRPENWTEVLGQINELLYPPSLIVTSRLADERLWAEALNLGAWDVLAKPFDRTEVLRSVKAAWQHWHDQVRPATEAIKAAS